MLTNFRCSNCFSTRAGYNSRWLSRSSDLHGVTVLSPVSHAGPRVIIAAAMAAARARAPPGPGRHSELSLILSDWQALAPAHGGHWRVPTGERLEGFNDWRVERLRHAGRARPRCMWSRTPTAGIGGVRCRGGGRTIALAAKCTGMLNWWETARGLGCTCAPSKRCEWAGRFW